MDPLKLFLHEHTALWLHRGDLVAWAGDAIVNAANQRMLGGGGVDGAIHRAAGPELLTACREVPEVQAGIRCPTGSARLTPAFGALKVSHVIHTVGPRYRNAQHSAPLLASAYRESLLLANNEGLESIAFPAISCGIYGYPLAEAALIALRTCCEQVWAWRQNSTATLNTIAFVLFNESTFAAWHDAAVQLELPMGAANARESV